MNQTDHIENQNMSIKLMLNPYYTFDTFLVAPSNQFAYYAARSVVENPGISYNPFVIYGEKGLGKTHLLHAIGNATIERNPSWQVYFSTAEQLVNNLVLAIKNGRFIEFKDIFRTIDVLLLDDVQFLIGKQNIQEEVYRIFNSFYARGKQIALTSSKWPGKTPDVRSALLSRFKMNLIADIQQPMLRIKSQ